MHFSDLRPAAVGLCLLATTIAGCSATQGRLGGTPLPPNVRTARPATNQNLYVANYRNSTVTVYAPDATVPLRTIGLWSGVSYPTDLAFDSHRNLYVSNRGTSDVTVYAPGHTSASRTLSEAISIPTAVALDASGNVFVANAGNSTVSVYRAGTTSLIQVISNGVKDPAALAFDPAGNLFVVNRVSTQPPTYGNVTVYHGTATSMTKIGTITNNIDEPVAVAVDPSGQDVFVVNELGNSVSEYSTKTLQHIRNISIYMASPDALTFDASGNLYVANKYGFHGNGSVTVYAAGTFTWMDLLGQGISAPAAVAIDPSGNPVVANDPASNTSVTEYGSNGRTIDETTGHVAGPDSLAFGP